MGGSTTTCRGLTAFGGSTREDSVGSGIPLHRQRKPAADPDVAVGIPPPSAGPGQDFPGCTGPAETKGASSAPWCFSISSCTDVSQRLDDPVDMGAECTSLRQ